MTSVPDTVTSGTSTSAGPERTRRPAVSALWIHSAYSGSPAARHSRATRCASSPEFTVTLNRTAITSPPPGGTARGCRRPTPPRKARTARQQRTTKRRARPRFRELQARCRPRALPRPPLRTSLHPAAADKRLAENRLRLLPVPIEDLSEREEVVEDLAGNVDRLKRPLR